MPEGRRPVVAVLATGGTIAGAQASATDAGYRAVAPFLRGYAPTSVPADGEYGVGALAADALAFADALGGSDDDVLIGHDWGAFATYCVGAYAPERFKSYVTMAVPPTAATMSTFFTHAQLKRSFYVFLFQTPLAEAAVPMNDFALIEGLWADWSPGYDGAIDVSHVREALRDWKAKRAVQMKELEALKADIDRGLADLAAGRVKDFDADRIIARGRKLLADR